jgi:hypothetical protein
MCSANLEKQIFPKINRYEQPKARINKFSKLSINKLARRVLRLSSYQPLSQYYCSCWACYLSASRPGKAAPIQRPAS